MSDNPNNGRTALTVGQINEWMPSSDETNSTFAVMGGWVQKSRDGSIRLEMLIDGVSWTAFAEYLVAWLVVRDGEYYLETRVELGGGCRWILREFHPLQATCEQAALRAACITLYHDAVDWAECFEGRLPVGMSDTVGGVQEKVQKIEARLRQTRRALSPDRLTDAAAALDAAMVLIAELGADLELLRDDAEDVRPIVDPTREQ